MKKILAFAVSSILLSLISLEGAVANTNNKECNIKEALSSSIWNIPHECLEISFLGDATVFELTQKASESSQKIVPIDIDQQLQPNLTELANQQLEIEKIDINNPIHQDYFWQHQENQRAKELFEEGKKLEEWYNKNIENWTQDSLKNSLKDYKLDQSWDKFKNYDLNLKQNVDPGRILTPALKLQINEIINQ